MATCRVIAILSIELRRRMKRFFVQLFFVPPPICGTITSRWELMMLFDFGHQRGSAKEQQGTTSDVKPYQPAMRDRCADGEYRACMTRGSLKQLGLLTGCLPISNNGPQMRSACPFLCHLVNHSGMDRHLPLAQFCKGTARLGMSKEEQASTSPFCFGHSSVSSLRAVLYSRHPRA